jgi:hypothetical protein
MSRKCSVCGRDGADILCSSCGNFVCERCYDPETDTCVKCSGKTSFRGGFVTSPALLVTGFILIMLGLMVTAWALLPASDTTIVVFPFIFNSVNSSSAFLMSVMFFAMFSLSSLLPLYLIMRRMGEVEYDSEFYTLQDTAVMGRNSGETIEYIITLDVPKTLKDSIYIEEDEESLTLLSNVDESFVKTYTLPDGFHVDDVESDYEGNFLLVKVSLMRNF